MLHIVCLGKNCFQILKSGCNASFCMYGRLWLKLVRVRVGSNYSKDGGLLVDVNSIIVHESYNDSTSDCDIALLKVYKSP